MSFVILSTGGLARSSSRTLTGRTVVCAGGIAMLAILACGVAAGYWLGQATSPVTPGGAAAEWAALPLKPDEVGNRALIDRVGTLSARLIRLETEAVSLARQVGVMPNGASGHDATAAGAAPADADTSEAPADSDEPSGGPFVAAGELVLPAAVTLNGIDFAGHLARLAFDLDWIEATFARVAQATAVRDLDTMAFPSRLPLTSATITSGFGTRRDPFTQRLARHTGLDFRAPYGASIFASAGGRVRYAGNRGAYGNTVEIDHGDGLVTRYGHASRLFVRAGQVVLPGQRIAAVGSTGRSTGPHLHFEVLRNGTPVEPRLYLARGES